MIRTFSKRSANSLPDTSLLAVAMIALAALLTHGLAIPGLGYSYDDWYMLWSGHARGAFSLVSLFSWDRPFMGVVYTVFYRILGENIAGWHLFALFFRIAGACAFYWILRLAWPRLKGFSVPAAMLFVVFPGFLAEPNAATKINHLLGYAAVLFSIAFSLQALRTDRAGWKRACLGLSLLSMAVYLWLYEYMIGLEVMRLVLLAWILRERQPEKLWASVKRLARLYLPYALLILVFLSWRVFIFDSPRSATDVRGLAVTYFTDFGGMLLRLAFQALKDFLSAAFLAWFVQPYHLLASAGPRQILLALASALLLAGLGVLYLYAARREQTGEDQKPAPLILAGLGALIVLGAVFPVVLSNRYLNLMDPYKSYALHPSAGALILALGLGLMLKPRFRKIAFVAFLALSAFTLSLNGQQWAKYWEVQKNFWWQMTWRAPDIGQNTLFVGSLPPEFAFHEDYELWGPLNRIYRPGPSDYPSIQAQVLNQETLGELLSDAFVESRVRDIYLPRYYANLLVASQPTLQSCVHVIDRDLPAYSSSERALIEKIGGLSNTALIQTGGAPPVPPRSIFGMEPDRGWCYFYQQAALARQLGDWERIGALHDEAAAAGWKAGDASEYFVFVEGLVNLGREAEAAALVEREIKPDPLLRRGLCRDLGSAPAYPVSYGYRLDEITRLICAE